MIIGITGFKRTGKDTLAQILTEEATKRGKRVKKRAYADKLKIAAARSLGFDRSEQELIDIMDAFKETAEFRIRYVESSGDQVQHDLTGREYLQWFGTEGARQTYGDNFWVNQVTPPNLDERYRLHGADVDLLVVPDVRFLSEVQSIRGTVFAGCVVKVVRDGYDGSGHSSEAGIDDAQVDFIVENNSDLAHLRSEANRVLDIYIPHG